MPRCPGEARDEDIAIDVTDMITLFEPFQRQTTDGPSHDRRGSERQGTFSGMSKNVEEEYGG